MKKHKRDEQYTGHENAQDERNQEKEEIESEEIILTFEQVEELKERVEDIQKERDQYLDAARRAQADLDNYRKRNVSLRMDSLQEGKCDVMTEILPVLDNFERALQQAQGQKQASGFIEGFDMIYRQLVAVLEKNQVSEIACTGQPFDPNTQQAVLQEASDDAESGTVLEVLQKGYQTKDGKILRHSMVKVSQ